MLRMLSPSEIHPSRRVETICTTGDECYKRRQLSTAGRQAAYYKELEDRRGTRLAQGRREREDRSDAGWTWRVTTDSTRHATDSRYESGSHDRDE